MKTLVVKRSDDTFVFALVPGGRKIAWPKLRALLGVNKLQLPDASVALAATGYERGTITPFGSTTAWPVVADATIAGRTVSMGAGEHGYSLFVDADALIAAYGAHGRRHHRPRVAIYVDATRRRPRGITACCVPSMPGLWITPAARRWTVGQGGGMRRPGSLPPIVRITAVLDVRRATCRASSRSRLRRTDLVAPFHGVRTSAENRHRSRSRSDAGAYAER